MRRLSAIFLLPLLCLGCPIGYAGETTAQNKSAQDTQTRWMTVLLGGRKIGHVEIVRQHDGHKITTTQTLSLEFSRAGSPLHLASMSRSIESSDGPPLGFAAMTRMSAQDSTIDGQRDSNGNFRVLTTVGGLARQSTMPWPQDALLVEGQRRAMLAAGRQAGTIYQLRAFNPASQQVLTIRMQVLGDELVSLPEGTELLSHQRQLFGLSHGNQSYDLWLDEQGFARKGSMNLIGQRLEMLACSQACALAPNQDVDMFRSAMIEAPRPLTPNLRKAPLHYRVYLSDNRDDSPFINTDEQRVTPLSKGHWQIDVTQASPGGQPPPQPKDSAPNAWLQSDAPEIRRLAAKVVGSVRDNRNKMRRLRSFVSDYITEHGLDVGYASALEVLHYRQGDCTEYAVLLAALARAEGIPARVVSGMVYADRYAGSSHVFLPHQWVQAWIEGRWESYDAALRRFDTTHIALASGDGDPWNFYEANRLFGSIHITVAMPDAELFRISAPEAAPAAPAKAGQ